jgi:hypothetical protein
MAWIARLVVAVHPASMDVAEARARHVLEVMGVIAVESVVAALIPESAVIAPVAIHERAVGAIIVPVIIVRSTGDLGPGARAPG